MPQSQCQEEMTPQEQGDGKDKSALARRTRIDARNGLGRDVKVLAGVQGHVDARQLTDLLGPHASAVDDVLALDVTLARAHAGHGVLVRLVYARHTDVLNYLDALGLGASSKGARDVRRRCLFDWKGWRVMPHSQRQHTIVQGRTTPS
jgi:hypothetical protein